MNTASNNNKHSGYLHSEMRKLLITEWQMPADSIPFLRNYFIRKWHTANFLALIKDGCLFYENTKYQVHWKQGKVEDTKHPMILLSFRKPAGNLQAVVLAKKAPLDIPSNTGNSI